jgi:hypothetical protein
MGSTGIDHRPTTGGRPGRPRLRRLLRDQRGGVAMLVGLVLLPLIGAMGHDRVPFMSPRAEA